MNRISRHYIVSLVVAAAASLVASLASAQISDAQMSDAKKLFNEGMAATARKDYAAACPKFEEVVRLVPKGAGARIALGGCYESAGRLASAWTTYLEAESIAAQTMDSARQKEAREHGEKVQPRLAKLTVIVPEEVRTLPGLSVERDGVPVSSVEWGVPVPVDKGKHAVVVTATGKQRWEKTLEILDGAPQAVMLEVPADVGAVVAALSATSADMEPADVVPADVEPADVAPADEEPADVAPADVAPADVAPADVAPVHVAPVRVARRAVHRVVAEPLPYDGELPYGSTELEILVHRWRPGVVARLDIDRLHGEGRAALGLTIGRFDHLELGVSALLGSPLGVEPQVTAFVLKGAVKPLINVGVPIFFGKDPQIGFRGAAGVQWDVNRNFGIFAQVGGGYFVGVPRPNAPVVFLPALGVQGRL